jgi:hypothetical protein
LILDPAQAAPILLREMSYSDEPHVISERKKSSRIYLVVGLLALFLLALGSVAFYPRYLDFKRRNAPVGPHGGTLHFISFEGNRYSMELARSEALDFRLHVVIHPVRETTPWRPEDYQVRYRFTRGEDREWRILEWDPELRSFGPSEEQFHPRGDYRLDLQLLREGRSVWEGLRWTYPGGGGHGH